MSSSFLPRSPIVNAVLQTLRKGFSVDRRRMSLGIACLRVIRSSPMFAMRDTWRQLLANAAFRRHVASISGADVLFFLSHRHYLAQGLSRRERAALALHHYQHETTAFDADYLDEVYAGDGLQLWHAEHDGTSYELRLMPGHDVLYEGGLSVVLSVDGGRVCVVSFSYVDGDVIYGHPPRPSPARQRARTTVFVARKQLASNHGYQRRFHPGFHRCTPEHFCIAALTGIVMAQGHRSFAAIRPAAHPGYTPERAPQFDHAYSRFWESLSGRVRGPYAFELPAPMGLPSLESLSPKARRRARARRRHLEEIRDCAEAIVRSHLRSPPAPDDPADSSVVAMHGLGL